VTRFFPWPLNVNQPDASLPPLVHTPPPPPLCILYIAMEKDFEDFFAQQDKLLALPEEDIDSYHARRANPDKS